MDPVSRSLQKRRRRFASFPGFWSSPMLAKIIFILVNLPAYKTCYSCRENRHIDMIFEPRTSLIKKDDSGKMSSQTSKFYRKPLIVTIFSKIEVSFIKDVLLEFFSSFQEMHCSEKIKTGALEKELQEEKLSCFKCIVKQSS